MQWQSVFATLHIIYLGGCYGNIMLPVSVRRPCSARSAMYYRSLRLDLNVTIALNMSQCMGEYGLELEPGL